MRRALDLFCGAGGATRGLQLAGFHVTGVDLRVQPNYCGDYFIRADAVADTGPGLLRAFDFVWASPPCQAHTAMRTMHNAKPHVDLIPETREMLRASGVPYVIENVEGAPLVDPIRLCGTMFGLGASGADLHRHRMFEASFKLPMMFCRHEHGKPVIGVYGGHVRNRKRRDGSASRGVADFTPAEGAAALGLDWPMTLTEMSQAIPPAYSRWIAEQWLASVAREAAE